MAGEVRGAEEMIILKINAPKEYGFKLGAMLSSVGFEIHFGWVGWLVLWAQISYPEPKDEVK